MGPIYNNLLDFNATSTSLFLQKENDTQESILHRLERGGRVPSAEKFRRMCCFTHIITGGCPYGDKCVFLHDPRLSNKKDFKIRSTKQPRVSGQPKDTFYWPDMDKENIYNTVNMNGLPLVGQSYVIPAAFANGSTYHDRAMFSMWEHFQEAVANTNNQKYDPRGYSNNATMSFKQALFKMTEASREPLRNITNEAPFKKVKASMYENIKENRHLPNRKRLAVFIKLADN